MVSQRGAIVRVRVEDARARPTYSTTRALSEFGKLGMVAIGDNPQQAKFLYNKTLQVLDQETR